MSTAKRPGSGRPRRRQTRQDVQVDLEQSGTPAQALESLKRARKIVARWIISKALSTHSASRGEAD